MGELQAMSSSGADQAEVAKKGTQTDESELRLAQLQHQLPANEPGTLMHLVKDAASAGDDDDDDAGRRECKSLFKNLKFFLSREVCSSIFHENSVMTLLTSLGNLAIIWLGHAFNWLLFGCYFLLICLVENAYCNQSW